MSEAGLVVFLACRLVVGFVLELVKSASLDGLHGPFVIAGIGNSLFARLSFIFIFIFVVFLFFFLVFGDLFGRS